MLLGQLVEVVPGAEIRGSGDVDVQGIAYDSRAVRPGYVFAAICGYRDDGLRYTADAIGRGAVAIISDRQCQFPVPTVIVPDARRALSAVSARFYDYPSRDLKVIGITGTNGKTTTAHLIRSILTADGRQAAVMGTIGVQFADKILPAAHTTPEAPDIQGMFRDMLDRGITDVVMEASSHALFLHRTADIDFDIGVFTNLSPEHLDFHPDLEHYRRAKAELFAGLRPGRGRAVINIDDPSGQFMIDSCAVPVISFGFGDADVTGEIKQINAAGTDMIITCPGGDVDIALRLLGRFNAANALAAAATAWAMGIPLGQIKQGLEGDRGIPGRFEQVTVRDADCLPVVIVDYAHTPDGLEKVLHAARECCSGRVFVVFGCGGDRDRSKRSVMGDIAGRLADNVIITSDNPRSENPQAITEQIERGIIQTGRCYRIIVDRKQAIEEAVWSAGPDDIVVIAGKGHETYQLIGEQTVPFDDRKQAAAALDLRREKGG